MRRASLVFAALPFALAASGARADATPPPPRRAVPDYDGRPDPAPSLGEDLLWVPRVLFFPPYLVSEYVLRRPLGALITTAERNDWAGTLTDIFTFGPDHKAGLVPTAFFDFGLRPSVGLYFFWDDALTPGHDLRAHVSYYGSDWLLAGVSERFHLGKASLLAIDASFARRPDRIYDGEGPRTPQYQQSRYLENQVDLAPSFATQVVPKVTLTTKVGVRLMSFQESAFDEDDSVPNAVARGYFALPTGYERGYTMGYERADLAWDTRRDVGTTTDHTSSAYTKSGVRLAGYVEHGADVRSSPGSAWIKYGGAAGGYLDVWRQRVVSLTVQADFADAITGAIPFTEEVVWGGFEPLSGFLPGRLHGRSAIGGSLAYSWPIWIWLDGTMRASVGNVFDAGLRDFDPKLLRFSSGIGAQSSGSPDHRFEILFGVATETFDQGAKVDSIRLVIGGTNGF
jgi:hypothetical protein